MQRIALISYSYVLNYTRSHLLITTRAARIHLVTISFMENKFIFLFSDCVRQKQNPMPDVHIMYEDQPYNDFKSLFLMANGEYIK